MSLIAAALLDAHPARRTSAPLIHSRAPSVRRPPRAPSVLVPESVPPHPSSDAPRAETTEQLVAQLYGELCKIAQRLRRSERDDHTLQTTALVHEAFLRLAERHAASWQSRPYFLVAAAQTMRRVLVDYARERSAAKRSAGMRTTLLSFADVASNESPPLDVLALDDVLARLAQLDERQARVVELRVFGGFEVEEVAVILDVSTTTVKRDWRFAKAWLACQLSELE